MPRYLSQKARPRSARRRSGCEGVHLTRKRVVVKQGIGRGVRTARRKVEVVNARGRTDAGFHEEEGEFKVADGGKQPGLRISVGVSVVVQAGQEPGREHLADVAVLAVLVEAELDGLCLSA